ncbi:MAG: IS1380 family transposase, partial [Pseudomonadota bacterium]
HPITVWAGVILLRLYFEVVGLRPQLTAVLGGFGKRSNNQIPAPDVLLCWFYGLALGAARFAHFTRYRRDPLLPRLLGIRRLPSPDTLRRLFAAFTYRTTTEVSEALMRWSLRTMRPILLGHTLDLDSTVFCRYGDQEGSLKGHNPVKHGRPSHHPLLAFLCESRRLLWATLRAGHAGTANGVGEFVAQALTMLPAGHRIGLVRADSGFFVTSFLVWLEARALPYVIVARLTPILRRLVLQRIPDAAWRPVGRGIDVADLETSLPGWGGTPRRFVCLRQRLAERPEARGRRLFEWPDYTFRVFVTSVPYAAELVTRLYAGRADSENRIKELKDDLSLDTFCLQAFDATDAAFRTGCVLYNLLAGFRETVLPRAWFARRLRAVRDFVFLVGADLIPRAHAVQVRFAVPRAEREDFLQRLRTLAHGLPIAAQLDWELTDGSPEPATPPEAVIPRLPPRRSPRARPPVPTS